MQPLGVELEDVGAGEGKEDGRVRDDDVLGACVGHFGDAGEERELAVGRQGRFGFVHDEQALLEGGDEAQKALAVGLLVEGAVAEHRPVILFVFDGLGGDIVEAFRPEEEPVPLPRPALADRNGLIQRRMRVERREVVVQGPALRIEPVGYGDGLQQRRLPRPVLPHEKSDRLPELQPLEKADGRNPCHIRLRIHPVPIERNIIDIHKSANFPLQR